jgi:hypothetical protein
VAAQPEPAVSSPAPDIVAGPEFPIGLWWPPPPAETTASRYVEIADAGFTFVHGGNGVVGVRRSSDMLELADDVGLDAVVVDPRVRRLAVNDPSPAEVEGTVGEALADYERFPAFAGFNLFDEPNAERFPALATLTAELRRQAPEELGYVNLWPSDVPPSDWGRATYEEYLQRFTEEVRPSMLSFDVYPLLDPDDDAPGQRPQPLAEDEETLSQEFFDNWEMVRRQALRSGLPAWVFIQSVDYDLQPLLCPCRARRQPNEAEVRWQANIALANGIQWFTYWTPNSNPGTTFGEALLTFDGERTELYQAAKRVNPELQAIGSELLDLQSETISHTSEGQLPPGTRPHHPNAWIGNIEGGDPLVVGRFEGDSPHSRKLLVVNRSMLKPAHATIDPRQPVAVTRRMDPASGTWTAGGGCGASTQVDLPAGGAVLLELNRRPPGRDC